DLQRYLQFLFDCARDPRFTASFILPEIEYNHHITLLENILYRLIIIPRTKKMLLAEAHAFAWMQNRPPTGPGRTDLNPFKIQVLGLPDDGSVGSADIMPLWQSPPTDFHRHWDGLNPSLREAIVSGALATGTNAKEINLKSLDRIETWMATQPAPAYPFAIDDALATQGQAIFTAECAACHAQGGDRTGQVIPLSEVLTDPNRAQHWTAAAAAAFNTFAEGKPWDFDQFQDTDGYTAVALTGLWARAPYLHNGSVPSLAALLTPPAARPTTFYRGYDLYDPANVGFVSSGPEAAKVGFKVDTQVVGNGNQGHLYGTELSAAEKRSLLEYLKTL
ncbi:MAG TPA: cytochrome c, partial [Candidatus Obscuribacterales bacterium]